jgi:hypothetical protein
MTPYEVVYGKKPPFVDSYLPFTSKVNTMDSLLKNREATLVTLKENLEMDQNSMKQQAYQLRFEHSFEGGQVFLHIHTYK